MSTVYNGNPAGGAWTPAISITEPADTDNLNVASVNPAFSKLADYIAKLQAEAAQLGGANTFTAAAVFQALVSFTGNVAFSAAVAQTLLKTAAGGFTVGTAAGGGDLTLSANGTPLLKLLSSGSLDAQGKVLANLATPAAAADAATKGYVDGKFPSIAWTAPTMGSGFSSGAAGQAVGFFRDTFGIVHFKGQATCTGSFNDITAQTPPPAGLKPAADRYFAIMDVTAGVLVPAYVGASYGHIHLVNVPTSGHVYDVSGIAFAGEV